MYRHFATDPSAWHLIRMPIAERLGPAPTPTPFCGSQKTARACLWSRANYSSLKRGEKLYLCCQLLEKHKDFCGLKKKKKRKKMSEWACAWQGKEATCTWVYQGDFVSERREKARRKPQAQAARVQRDMEDTTSCLGLVSATAFCPIARLFLFKGGDYTENRRSAQLNQPGALGRTAPSFS